MLSNDVGSTRKSELSKDEYTGQKYVLVNLVGARLGRGDRQPTVSVRASRLCLLERLLSAATTASSRPLLVDGCRQDDGPGVYYQSPGLM